MKDHCETNVRSNVNECLGVYLVKLLGESNML